MSSATSKLDCELPLFGCFGMVGGGGNFIGDGSWSGRDSAPTSTAKGKAKSIGAGGRMCISLGDRSSGRGGGTMLIESSKMSVFLLHELKSFGIGGGGGTTQARYGDIDVDMIGGCIMTSE